MDAAVADRFAPGHDLGRLLDASGHQLEGDGDAFADIAVGADLSAHGLYDAPRQRRSEAGPAGADLFLVEGRGLEDIGQMLGRQPLTAVADPALQPNALCSDLGLETGFYGAATGGLHRRGDQIVEHLAQAGPVDHDLEVRIAIIGDQHRDFAGLALPAGLDVVHARAQGGGLGFGHQLPGLAHGQVDRLGQQLQQALGGGDDGAHIGLGVGGQRLALQEVGDRQDAAHRGADLAAQHLHELAADVGLRRAAGPGLQRLQERGAGDQAGVGVVIEQDHGFAAAALGKQGSQGVGGGGVGGQGAGDGHQLGDRGAGGVQARIGGQDHLAGKSAPQAAGLDHG